MARYTLKKRMIIKENNNFSNVIKNGRYLNGKYMTVYAIAAAENKVGFTTSRMLKRAVDRNYVRRRLREIFRTNQEILHKNHFMVILGKPGILTDKYYLINNEFQALARKMRL